MGLIVALVTTALGIVVYFRMYKRELPQPVGWKQAIIPVGLGIPAVILSTLFFILIGLLTQQIPGIQPSEIASPVLRSLIVSFLSFGFTEELVKFLLFLVVIWIIKPKNVYEFGFLCAGVGLGFTFLEDVLYAGQSLLTAVVRIPFFAMHMVFGILMGTNLGLAKFTRQEGGNDAGKYIFLAFFLPVLWHTVFDASTTVNSALNSEDKNIQIAGVVIAIAVCVFSIALQFVVLFRFKKKTEEYCGMQTQPAELLEEQM